MKKNIVILTEETWQKDNIEAVFKEHENLAEYSIDHIHMKVGMKLPEAALYISSSAHSEMLALTNKRPLIVLSYNNNVKQIKNFYRSGAWDVISPFDHKAIKESSLDILNMVFENKHNGFYKMKTKREVKRMAIAITAFVAWLGLLMLTGL